MTEDAAVARAAAAAALGHRSRLPDGEAAELESAARDDPDARVRAAALAAFVRVGSEPTAQALWAHAARDVDAHVRRRAADLAPALHSRVTTPNLVTSLTTLLDDPDVTVVEAAAWALGELGAQVITGDSVRALCNLTTGHRDPLAREAAVAALGAIGDPAGLPAILTACRDKPAVRRRAVLALAPYEGPEVDAALHSAEQDRDWQVRQAAEDLLAAERE